MYIDVVVDVSGDRYVAWVDTMPDARASGVSAEEAEQRAVGLFLKAISEKVYAGQLLPEMVFPLFVTPLYLELSYCVCTGQSFHDPHTRADHERLPASPDGAVSCHGKCMRRGCPCRGFAPMWGGIDVRVV